MKVLSSIRTMAAFVFRRPRVEREMEEELRSRLQDRADDLERQGLSRRRAERQARIEFGGYQRCKEECREALGMRLFREFVADARYGLRQLRRNPGFTAVAVITLALGIGANTAIFSVVNAVLLQPLPYPSPSRLVYLSEFWPHEPPVHTVVTPDFANWQRHNHVFQALGAYGGDRRLELGSDGEPETVEAINISEEFFRVLGVQPALGRSFLPEEEIPGGRDVVIISHAIWQQRFGSDPKSVGKSVRLDGQQYTVVGVLPAGFRFPDNDDNPELFLPDVAAAVANWHSPNYFRLQPVIARLKPGVTQAQARAELRMLVRRTAPQEPAEFVRMRKGMEVRVTSLHERLAGNVRPLLLMLFGAVCLVLLIACVNATCLQLARVATRQKEVAVRAALGAGRVRVARQLLAESLLLAGFGGAVGLFLGVAGVRIIRILKPQQIPHLEVIRISGPVLLFTLVVAIATGLLFGLAPALSASRFNLNEMLKESGPTGIGAISQRTRKSLVGAEMALATLLLAGAGLLVRTFIHLADVDPGCDIHHLLTLRVDFDGDRYSTSVQQIRLLDALVRQVRALPGVETAAMSSGVPLAGWGYLTGMGVEGKPLPPKGLRPDVPYDRVIPGFFRAVGIPLIAGRPFSEHDGKNAPLVAVVNRAFASQFFPGPGRGVIGKHVFTGSWREIVGIVENVRQNGAGGAASPEVYAPFVQEPDGCQEMILAVRTKGNPHSLSGEVRKAVEALDVNEPVFDVATMEQRWANSMAPQRFNMLLISMLAGLALILAAVGIYGVVSYSVVQSTHEIGVRMALGAQKMDVLATIVKRGMELVLIDGGIGLGGALALARFLRSLLYGVQPTDPLTFAAVSIIVMAVALLACYIPARRATRVDPAVALRHQ
jgi:putative ABC transport system permease protein